MKSFFLFFLISLFFVWLSIQFKNPYISFLLGAFEFHNFDLLLVPTQKLKKFIDRTFIFSEYKIFFPSIKPITNMFVEFAIILIMFLFLLMSIRLYISHFFFFVCNFIILFLSDYLLAKRGWYVVIRNQNKVVKGNGIFFPEIIQTFMIDEIVELKKIKFHPFYNVKITLKSGQTLDLPLTYTYLQSLI